MREKGRIQRLELVLPLQRNVPCYRGENEIGFVDARCSGGGKPNLSENRKELTSSFLLNNELQYKGLMHTAEFCSLEMPHEQNVSLQFLGKSFISVA